MTFIEFKAIIKETRLHLKTIWTCWISASSLNFTFQRWKPRSRAFRGRCVCVCVSELRVFVVVCVTFQKVSEVCELRLTEEECEDFCCHVKAAVVYWQIHAEEVAQLCVCVCVFVSFIASLPENVGVASHFWHNCVSCKLHYNFGACNSWYSIYLHLYFKQIIGEINLLRVHEKAGLLWRATPMS